MLRDPAKFGLSATDVTRYQNANETKLGLDHDAGDPLHPKPVYLFAYDPTAFGGKGRAAIAIGNPDTAKNTAVIVPGTSSSVKGGWLHDGHNDAINLFEQANAADPHNPTAVIAWMGYDAPNGFDDVQRISTPALARAGSASLAQDVNGLWATHLGAGQHVTVLGHSYGSTTVADAFAMHNMHANDAVLLGCPGTDMARSAEQFHLDGGHVFVGMPPPIRSACSVTSTARARSSSARTSSAPTPAWVPTPRSTGSGRYASAPRSPAPMASIPMTTRTTTTGAAKPSMACPTSSPATVTNYKPTA